MSRARRPVDIFNVSFLDVMACAVGVILFITLMSMTTAMQRVPAPHRERLESLRKREVANKARETEMAEAAPAAAGWRELKDAETALADLRDRLAPREAAVTQARAAAEGAARAAGDRTEAARLTAAIPLLDNRLARSAAAENLVARRRPVLRSTEKLALVIFMFPGDGNVRVFERDLPGYEWVSKHYDKSLQGDVHVFRWNRTGVVVKDVTHVGAISQNVLAGFDPQRHFIECTVSRRGFDDFAVVRESIYATGIEVGFRLMDDQDTVYFSSQGNKAPVQ